LIQLAKIGRIDVDEEDALRLATYKTACLFSVVRGSAQFSVVSKKGEQALADYGRLRGFGVSACDDCWISPRQRSSSDKPVLSD